jgi:chromosome segregation ATPase
MKKEMTIEEKYEDWKKKKTYHEQPSPETRERLVKLETNQFNLMEEIQDIKAMIKELGVKLDCALDKKADKWVQTAMTWFMYAVALGIIGTVGTLILKGIQHYGI